MEHLLLLTTTIGSKELTIGSVSLDNNLIVEANQAITSIDICRHGDQGSPFGSQKNSNEISVDFGRNADEKLELLHREPLEAHTHILPGPDREM